MCRSKGLLSHSRLSQPFGRAPDLELLVVGRLREGQTMEELNRLGIRERVKFVSGLSGEDIRDLYAEATIAVSPSVYEGFGFPAGEALSCGVPLVATDGGSLPEVVGDAGIIVPHSNPPALAEAIDALLKDPARREKMSVKARQHILDSFKWERCARDVVALPPHIGRASRNFAVRHADHQSRPAGVARRTCSA